MNRRLLYLFAFLAWFPFLHGMQAPGGQQLGTFKRYIVRGQKGGTYNGDTIGWLYSKKAGDSVLINLGKNPGIKEGAPIYLTTHFKYVAPAAPRIALPEGLFFWFSESTKPWLGKSPPLMKDSSVFTSQNGEKGENTYFMYDSNEKQWQWPDTGHTLKQYLKRMQAPLVKHPFLLGMQAPVGQHKKTHKLGTFKRYRGYKGDTIGWIYSEKAGDSVLINLGKNPGIKEGAPIYSTTNFKYIAPAAPDTALPEGIFFWYSNSHKPWLANRPPLSQDSYVLRSLEGKKEDIVDHYFMYNEKTKQWEWPENQQTLKQTGFVISKHPF